MIQLVESIRDTGRNVTTDNWLTSVPLAMDLFKNYKLTLMGIIRKNKRELSIELKVLVFIKKKNEKLIFIDY